jgi:hypothetical protein
MTEKPTEKANVIDLAQKRKRQGTLYRASQGKAKKGAQKKSTGNNLTWVQYVQFFAFLAVLALMMQLCQRG